MVYNIRDITHMITKYLKELSQKYYTHKNTSNTLP